MLTWVLIVMYIIMGLISCFASMILVDINNKSGAARWSNDDRFGFHVASLLAWPIVGSVLFVICFMSVLVMCSDKLSDKILKFYNDFKK